MKRDGRVNLRIVNAFIGLIVATSAVGLLWPESNARGNDDGAPNYGNARFSFALIGDTRYNPEGDAQWGPLQADINGNHKLKFVMHAGDLTGETPCTDAFYADRLAGFQAFNKPVIYTPGDNEWTDCHYSTLGLFNPLDRLRKLREVMFASPHLSLGQHPFEVRTQADIAGYSTYVENRMFVRGGVVFATVHMVGSSNGMAPWNRSIDGGPVYDATDTNATPRADRVAEVNARIVAGVAWLNEVFIYARSIDAKAVFLLSQANPGFVTRFETAPVPAWFTAWQAALQRNTLNFGGKPVVLAHGDTHTPRVDKPMTAATVPVVPAAPNPARVENFTRVETFGFPDTHWILVTVDPSSDEVFHFDFKTVAANRRQFVPIP